MFFYDAIDISEIAKVIIFGIALMCFFYAFLKGMVIYGIDEVISVIGLSFCVDGLVKKDNLK